MVCATWAFPPPRHTGGVSQEPDLLEEPPPPRLALPRRVPLAPRTLILVLLVLVPMIGGLYVLDRRAHARESAALDACAQELQAASVRAHTGVNAMAEYLRPTLSRRLDPVVRDGLLSQVADVAADKPRLLAGVRDDCAAVTVRFWHADLRARRTACVAESERQVSYFAEVAAYGRRAYSSAPSPQPC